MARLMTVPRPRNAVGGHARWSIGPPSRSSWAARGLLRRGGPGDIPFGGDFPNAGLQHADGHGPTPDGTGGAGEPRELEVDVGDHQVGPDQPGIEDGLLEPGVWVDGKEHLVASHDL